MGSYTRGTSTRQTDSSLKVFAEEIYDEESNVSITMIFVCACEDTVYRYGESSHFFCSHCDRPCFVQDCVQCEVYANADEITHEGEEDGDNF